MCNDGQEQTLKPVLHVDVWNEEKYFLGKMYLLLILLPVYHKRSSTV